MALTLWTSSKRGECHVAWHKTELRQPGIFSLICSLPFLASVSCCLVMSKYLGDSGQKGSKINCSAGCDEIWNTYHFFWTLLYKAGSGQVAGHWTKTGTTNFFWMPRRMNGMECRLDLEAIMLKFTGITAKPRRIGHPSSVPRRLSIPRIWEINRPTVTANWFTVPKPPRRVRGAISDIYIGTNDVFKPETRRKCPQKPASDNATYVH